MRNKSMMRALVAGVAVLGLTVAGAGSSEAANKNIPYGLLKANTGASLDRVNGYAEMYLQVGYRITGGMSGTLYQVTSSGPDARVAACTVTLSGASQGHCSAAVKPEKGKCYYTRTVLRGTVKLANSGVKMTDISTSVTDPDLVCY